MTYLFILFAFIAGIVLPVQASINAQLKNYVGTPLIASAISFLVGLLALLIGTLIHGTWNLGKNLTSAPWWIWTGGLLGAFYVLATIILIPRLGAATTVACVLAGQVVVSIIIDHFGLLQVTINQISIPRLIGAVLIIVGVILVQKF
ncbi:DMT family transporter [Metabacillus sediminilitoris]|uniref:DMT family transporter n=1 Tax=Metabacillus sediminilitoris TaxID=2567941 RepID=A0A4S4BME1_9BACI|nr:DMT family transporter [Metabacillus sediminilitoris]QGQ44063.1 EamA-like transporter family protein [Metabacillus sediminilitoris]THF75423.1 DMT family transporter [Metabacillus sediminilitoris]